MNPGRICYVGVDLEDECVVAIAVDPEIINPNAYVLSGEFSGALDGVIFLDTSDDSHNGRRAREIALASTTSGEIGLGWTFKLRLSDEWSR